ncbi:FeoB-associated Cys-rich membrane protein [Anaerococcus sp. NML200574]|uniref:FeoB-associated Cys-rich membrane protein n=1 Tax=Anaerococcus sp. NML200574 TaxID=2954486 RepID=UPI0022371E6C|nr:FeoB-associated Cys-rich membrane protein [Anaerococcus sp. NML200574]MCW6677662.1 FeoB-associated Cys-rich membrane protein [Anaerococcus sp. NML200574]
MKGRKMNLPSWIILILVLAACSYIIYSRFIKKTSGDCGGCSGCSSHNDHKSCCH